MNKGFLVLENGLVFEGLKFGVNKDSKGEIVFNTSMTGYQEVITDPSYYQQIVTFTYPHFGNVGFNFDDFESTKVWLSGVVCKSLSPCASNYRANDDIESFFKKNKIVGISDVDTRQITKIIRSEGSMNCLITSNIENIKKELEILKKENFLKGKNTAKIVSTKNKYIWKYNTFNIESGTYPESLKSDFKVAAIDCGVKKNILRKLTDRNCIVTVFPYDVNIDEIDSYNPDGIFLSNGPGDPEPCSELIKLTKLFVNKNIPIFGICLGHQILALALGAQTKKMKFGHHGSNHPVQDLKTKKVFITSQNHCYTVNGSNIGKDIKITHKSLFDNTVQGIEHISGNFFSFQGHPEASPGPQEADYLFDKFINIMKKNKSTNA